MEDLGGIQPFALIWFMFIKRKPPVVPGAKLRQPAAPGEFEFLQRRTVLWWDPHRSGLGFDGGALRHVHQEQLQLSCEGRVFFGGKKSG